MNLSHKGFNPEYAEQEPTFEQVSSLPGKTIIEFGAPWCGHCQAANPAIEQVLNEYSELSHIKIYDGKGKPLGRAFKVKLWPTLILLHDGQEVARLVRPLAADEVRKFVTETN